MSNIFNSDIKKIDSKKNYYIWFCPNLDCKTKGIVLFKTELPCIGSGKIKCSACGKLYDFKQIMQENKGNIERYLAEIGG